ncbi:hypothetical protein [Streptomyces sp. NPDC055107]
MTSTDVHAHFSPDVPSHADASDDAFPHATPVRAGSSGVEPESRLEAADGSHEPDEFFSDAADGSHEPDEAFAETGVGAGGPLW